MALGPHHVPVSDQTILPPLSTIPAALTLSAKPSTDIWCVPSSRPHFSAPFTCTTLPLSSFRSISATILAPNFSINTQQGGLLLVLPPSAHRIPSSSSSGSRAEREGSAYQGQDSMHWVTATLEYEHSRLNVSVVSCEKWADWSLHGMPGAISDDHKTTSTAANSVKLKMERRLEEDGTPSSRLIVSMWERTWRIIREITWAFAEEESKVEADRELWVGVLANQASAAGEMAEGGVAKVHFEDINVETI